ncbi:hypothetical protein FSP39_020583 [Pinctada imbricata]|uniref:H-type lectin domain-containing protein n=1 Tax=Pinctada imbricata TaxID=66713 RepID=A0AA88Y2R8_PINIB|nr:hypothetical protein FSP39_020583 [Pinctada imbricata]
MTGLADEVRLYSFPDNIFPYTHSVEFSTAFSSVPVISYGIIYFDMNYNENPRVNVQKESSNTTHVVFQLSTWSDTQMYALGISWIACD